MKENDKEKSIQNAEHDPETLEPMLEKKEKDGDAAKRNEDFDSLSQAKLYLPEGGEEIIPLTKIKRNAGKPYLHHFYSPLTDRTYKDCFLKKVGQGTYRIIINRNEEKQIWIQEEHFWINNFNKYFGDCDACNHAIYGKHAISIENFRRSYWEISYRCPNCDFTGVLQVNANILDREQEE